MNIYIEKIAVMIPGINNWSDFWRFCQNQHTALDFKEPTLQIDGLNKRSLQRIPYICKLTLATLAQLATPTVIRERQPVGIFASSIGDSETLNETCTSLLESPPYISPLKFSHSLLNTVAGIWSIQTNNHNQTLSLSGCEYSAASALLETALQTQLEQREAIEICYDIKTHFPNNSFINIQDHAAIALQATVKQTPTTQAQLNITVESTRCQEHWYCHNNRLNRLYKENPAARLLPLLTAIANQQQTTIYLQLSQHTSLKIEVKPC